MLSCNCKVRLNILAEHVKLQWQLLVQMIFHVHHEVYFSLVRKSKVYSLINKKVLITPVKAYRQFSAAFPLMVACFTQTNVANLGISSTAIFKCIFALK